MNPLLLVLNPRRISESLLTISALHIDQAWLTGYSEHELQAVIPTLVEQQHQRTHFIVLSDDTIPTQPALNRVLDLLEAGAPVATGYCNLDTSQDTRVNTTRSPLKRDTPSLDAYDFHTQPEIDAYPDPVFRTWFTGMALTAMTRSMWQRFPFKAYLPPGNASDFNLSHRLQMNQIPIWSHREARIHHIKDRVNYLDTDPRKQLLLGVNQGVHYRDADDNRMPTW